MKLGYLPPMTRGFTTDSQYVIPLVEMLEEADVESIWAFERVRASRMKSSQGSSFAIR